MIMHNNAEVVGHDAAKYRDEIRRGSLCEDVAVVLEYRFFQTPDGVMWTPDQFPQSFWERYLRVFDRVYPIARVQKVARPESGWVQADGPGIEFCAVPYFVGPAAFARQAGSVYRHVVGALSGDRAVILRVPGTLGFAAAWYLERIRKPYAIEVVADPFDVFSPGAVRHPFRPVFRRTYALMLKAVCKRASFSAYVTENALQRRYPTGKQTISFHYSSIELPETCFVREPRPARPLEDGLVALYVGTLEKLYKAPDILIRAMARVREAGVNLNLRIVGEGHYRSELQQLVDQLGLGDVVCFVGRLPSGPPIFDELDRADLFVLPSRQEGLPRAMIEAMARSLPAIGSKVGGIPELLQPDALVRPNDVVGLADKMIEVAKSTYWRGEAAAANLERARSYSEEVLSRRRDQMYGLLQEAGSSHGIRAAIGS